MTADAFFDNWAIYRAIIDHDCMEHRAIYRQVAHVLAERTEPIRVLDLGCGDAAGIAAVLSGMAVARYVGIDSAAPALVFAARRLAPLGDVVDLRVGDLLAHVEHDDETFDVVLVSFALHHLPADAKRRFLDVVRGRLRPGGELLVIDVVRRDGETREQYLSRYGRVLAGWPLSEQQRAGTFAHVAASDFPEQFATLPRWARELGYRDVRLIYRGGGETQAAWRMAA